MVRMVHYRAALFGALAFVLSVALAGSVALASLDLVAGARVVVQNKPMSDCASRATSALQTVMNSANELGSDGSLFTGASGPGNTTAAISIVHCTQQDTGYTATFTCSVEVPPNPQTADMLCTRLTAAFGGP